MISKTIGYNGVHNIFRHTHLYLFVVEGGTYAGISGKLKVGFDVFLVSWVLARVYADEMIEMWYCIIP